MLNALRLSEGFMLADFERETGLPAAAVLPKLLEDVARGLIAEQSGRFQATGLGFRFLNDLMAGFLPGRKRPQGSG